MSWTRRLAKVAFWLGIVFAIISIPTVALNSGAGVVGAIIVVLPLVAPYLYLQFAAGKESSEQTAG